MTQVKVTAARHAEESSGGINTLGTGFETHLKKGVYQAAALLD